MPFWKLSTISVQTFWHIEFYLCNSLNKTAYVNDIGAEQHAHVGYLLSLFVGGCLPKVFGLQRSNRRIEGFVMTFDKISGTSMRQEFVFLSINML